jgi:hypothetical protein
MFKKSTKTNKILQKSTKLEISFIFGDIYDILMSLGVEKIKEFQKIIDKKRFRVSDTTLTYRQVNFLDSGGFLNDDRDDKADWRKFSLKELFYLSIIKELRGYGFVDKQLKNLKKAFFSLDYSFSTDLAMMAIFVKAKIIMTVNNKGRITFYTMPLFYLLEGKSKSFINLNLNEILMDIWERGGKSRIEYEDELGLLNSIISDFETSDKESEILKIIRNKNYKSINIKKKGKEEFIIKGENVKEMSKEELLDAIDNKDFADIEILKRDGSIAKIKVEETFKI